MLKDSRDLPQSQVFRLHHAVVFICSPEMEPGPDLEPDPDLDPKPDPATPEPAPLATANPATPPRTYDEDGVHTLMTLRPLIAAVLRRRVPNADVPDLTQSVLIDLLDWWTDRGAGPVSTPEVLREVRACASLMARRAAYRYHRGQRRRGQPVASAEALFAALDEIATPALSDVPAEPSPEEAVIAAEAHAELASELHLDALAAATAPASWRAFYAYAVLGVAVEVIAESERVPVSTVYNRIRLARRDLRESLRRRRAAKRG